MHSFGTKTEAGGGIGRQVCTRCGHVVIELVDETEVDSSKLFSPGRGDSMFAIQAAIEELELPARRFGMRMPRNRESADID